MHTALHNVVASIAIYEGTLLYNLAQIMGVGMKHKNTTGRKYRHKIGPNLLSYTTSKK